MENDSEEKILKDYNTLMGSDFKRYREVFLFLKEYAHKNGRQSRITDYQHADSRNHEKMAQVQRRNRKEGGREFLSLWERCKSLKKRKKGDIM